MECVFLTKYLCYFILFLYSAVILVAAQEKEGDNKAFPPLWDLVPEQIQTYPVRGDKIVIDPWRYPERMGLYKILLNHSAKYLSAFGPNNSGNILWGLPLQHGWQFTTDRLQDPTNTTKCGHKDGDRQCLSVHNWWSYAHPLPFVFIHALAGLLVQQSNFKNCQQAQGMNYYLSVIPFLGAVESGLFGDIGYDVEMLPPEEQRADFCYSIADCNAQAPKVMAGWSNFFKYLLSTEPWSGIPAARSFSKDEALEYMWEAHILSIAFAVPKFQNRLPYLSKPESTFGRDWATAVDFIAATHLHTDQNTANRLQAGLPPRTLLEGDNAPFIADLTPAQNKVLFLLNILHNANEKTGKLLYVFWKAAMSTEELRKLGRSLIENIL